MTTQTTVRQGPRARRAHTRGWVQYARTNPSASLRLFCFSYAGGNAQIYSGWPAGLPREVEVGMVQLPGHGLRLLEKPIARMDTLVEEIVRGLRQHLDRPFALFGHSMGGLVAFEVARRLRREGLPPPARLYVSAREAPQVPAEPSHIHELPEPEFLKAIEGYGATPVDVLANAEMMRLLAPTLRADFAACETYEYAEEEPLDCSIRAYWGLVDPVVSREAALAWEEQTSGDFASRMIAGSHFYIHSAERVLLQMLAQDLGELVASEGRPPWSRA